MLPNSIFMRWIPSSDYVDVFWQSIRESTQRLPVYRSYLSEEEQIRAASIAAQDKRQQFILTRGHLRELLASALDCPPRDISLVYHASGKPATTMRFSGKQIYFNLSHSAELMVIVLSITRPVGIDVQQMAPRQNILSVAKRYFSAAEYQHLSLMPSALQGDCFYKFWVCKEALAKASQQSIWQILPLAMQQIAHKSSAMFYYRSAWCLQHLLANTHYMAALVMGAPAVTIRQHGLFATQAID